MMQMVEQIFSEKELQMIKEDFTKKTEVDENGEIFFKTALGKSKIGKIKSEEKSERDIKIDLMLSRKKKPYQSLGIGIHNNHFYFGTILESEGKKHNAIITDERKIYVCWNNSNDEIKEDFGLNYRFDLFDDCIDYMWSNESIKQFLDDKCEVKKIKYLFEEICKKNNSTVWHPDKRVHSYVSCDIISNYVYPIFNCKGRTQSQADFGSGKTRQALNYQLMSFNPLFAGNITPASFERVIESTGGTIIVDNFDNLQEDLKKLILQVIEVYYKKGSKTIKADGQGKQKNRPIAFNGYSPLYIDNIFGLPEVTESRCNKILMLKTDKKNIVDKKINPNDFEYINLRDALHLWALNNWKIVKQEYEQLEVLELSARDLERVEAVLTIAKIIGEDVYKDVLEWILENNEQQNIREVSDNWEFILFEYLNKIIKDGEKRLKVKEITEAIAETHFDLGDLKKYKQDKLKFSHYIGKILGNNKLIKKSIIDGWVHYTISKEVLDTLLKIKGFDKYLTIPHLTSLNLTNNTNNTNPTNLTNNTLNNQSVVSDVSNVKSTQGDKIPIIKIPISNPIKQSKDSE